MNCHFSLPSNSLVRRAVFEKTGGFDESLRAAQDHDMAIRVAEVTRLAFLNEELWCYRRHGQSISHARAMERWINGFTILGKAVRRYPYSRKVRRKRLAVLHFRVGQCLLEEKNLPFAALRFSLAGILDPARAVGVLLKREPASSPH